MINKCNLRISNNQLNIFVVSPYGQNDSHCVTNDQNISGSTVYSFSTYIINVGDYFNIALSGITLATNGFLQNNGKETLSIRLSLLKIVMTPMTTTS